MSYDPNRSTDPALCRQTEEHFLQRKQPDPASDKLAEEFFARQKQSAPLPDDVTVLQKQLRDIRDNLAGLKAVTSVLRDGWTGWYFECRGCGGWSPRVNLRDLAMMNDIEHTSACYVIGLLKLVGVEE